MNLFTKLAVNVNNTSSGDGNDVASLNIARTLAIAVAMKAIHVKTRSYAKHMALDEAFDDMNEAIDSFNECVQGYYRRQTGRQLSLKGTNITISFPDDSKVMEAVEKLEDDFREASDPLVKGVSPLTSLQDDVLNAFYRLYYRLDLK